MQKFSLFLATIFFFSLSADGQSLLNRLKEKTSAKVNQRAEQKVDRTIDKGLDGLENIFSKKSETSAASGEDPKPETKPEKEQAPKQVTQGQTEYSFKHRVTTEIITYQGSKVDDKIIYVMLVAADADNYMGTEINMESDGEQVNATMVFDVDNKSSIVLMNQAGMKIAMRQKMDYGANEASGTDIADFEYKKTGRTKKILGYACTEYEMIYEDNYSLLWITEDLAIKSFFGSLAELTKNSQYANMQMPTNGYMMEMTTWDKGKNKGNKTEMRVIKIEMNTTTQISTEGYTIMGD